MSEKNVSYGPGFGTLLCLAFIILKLCGVIAWSWFWVLSPVIIPCIFLVLLFGFILFCKWLTKI
jgi:hypothetical protein